MATTHDAMEDAWAWPCPYCGTSNSIESAVCVGCRAQLRDPEEDDLFTTVATDNAQMVDPDATHVREVLWSTEVPPEAVLAEEVTEADEEHVAAVDEQAPSAPFTAPANGGPFSAGSHHVDSAPAGPDAFGADRSPGGGSPQRPDARSGAPTPFGPGPSSTTRAPRSAPGAAPQASGTTHEGSRERSGHEPPDAVQAGSYGATGIDEHVTPDENGLSVAVAQLPGADRERCSVPIGVCGALLGDQEVVLGVLAGQLMGHAAVLMVTNARVLVANARRWKPLLDQFIPAPDLSVHLRHDRDIASLTIVQGPRLTTLDGITDVAGAVEVTDRVRALAERAGAG